MSPSLKRIHSDERLPTHADVVIIGGGIIGATAAYFLAKRGLSVALIEKGHVGCEQSSRNWGWCRQQNRDARELPTSGLAMRLWDELTVEIGTDLGFRRCGLKYATDDAKQLAEWEAWLDTALQFDINTRILNPVEATSAIQSVGRQWLGGVHSVDDGKAEPSLAVPGIAEGARAWCQHPPELRRLRSRYHQWRGDGRDHRARGYPHQCGPVCRRRLGIGVLSAARDSLPPSERASDCAAYAPGAEHWGGALHPGLHAYPPPRW
jgi:glycine/D-amino acid oxidase-like deaminating enzyme